MSRAEAFEDGMDRPLAMTAEAVRRHTAKQHNIAHDAPNAPQVTQVRPSEMPRDKFHPEASHHITVSLTDPGNPDVTLNHVYGVNTQNEYMHNHTIAHVHEPTGRAKTTFNPG